MSTNIEATLNWLWGNTNTKPTNTLANVDRAVDCGLVAAVGASALVTAQVASIATTNIPGASLVAAGMYRVSYYFRETTAATTSSSLIVTVGFNDGSAQTIASAAYTGNSTTAPQHGSVTVYAAAATALTYATTYASTGGTAMAYEIMVSATQIA